MPQHQKPPHRHTETSHDGGASRGDWLSTFFRNLRFAGRRIAKSPGFSATAVLSLALGIGASTAIFSLVNAVLLQDLPLRAPEELVEVYESTPDFEWGIFSYPDFEDFRDGTSEVFSGVAATRVSPARVSLGMKTLTMVLVELGN